METAGQVVPTIVVLHILPERTVRMLPYMVSGNWLVSYSSINGIDEVMKGMAQRTKFKSGMENAAEELKNNYEDYKLEFFTFFKELQTFTRSQPEFSENSK